MEDINRRKVLALGVAILGAVALNKNAIFTAYNKISYSKNSKIKKYISDNFSALFLNKIKKLDLEGNNSLLSNIISDEIQIACLKHLKENIQNPHLDNIKTGIVSDYKKEETLFVDGYYLSKTEAAILVLAEYNFT